MGRDERRIELNEGQPAPTGPDHQPFFREGSPQYNELRDLIKRFLLEEAAPALEPAVQTEIQNYHHRTYRDPNSSEFNDRTHSQIAGQTVAQENLLTAGTTENTRLVDVVMDRISHQQDLSYLQAYETTNGVISEIWSASGSLHSILGQLGDNCSAQYLIKNDRGDVVAILHQGVLYSPTF